MNPLRSITVYPSRAVIEASPGPATSRYALPLDYPGVYQWKIKTPDTADGALVLGHTGGTVGQWEQVWGPDVAVSGSPSAAVAAPYVPKIMMLGDSVTLGSTTAGFRQDLYRILRANRRSFKFIGTLQDGHPGIFTLGDWHHEGHVGLRIEQLDYAAYVAAVGQPDIVILTIATNNVSNGQSAAVMLGFLATLLDTIKSVSPSAMVLVSSIPPWVSPAASFAAKEIEREAYNAGIGALCTARGPNFAFVDGAKGMGGAHMGPDGIHPNKAGNEVYARNFADPLDRMLPPPTGLAMPRGLSLRPKQASFSFSANTDKITIPYGTGGHKPSVSGPFSVGLWFRPSSLSNGFFTLVQYGSAYQNGYVIGVSTTGGVSDAQVYFRTTGALTFATTGGVFVVNKWHRIWFCYDPAANEMRLYVTREGAQGHLAWVAPNPSILTTTTEQAATTLGSVPPGGSFNAAPGMYDGLTVCNNYAVSTADVESDYYEGALPSNVTAYYAISEGSGTSVADATGLGGPNGTTSGGAWVAAGTNPKTFDE